MVASRQEQELKVGDTLIETTLLVAQPRLWSLDDPFLYRVTARVSTDPTGSAKDPDTFHEQSVRCGFRDFRFDQGAFRLNGKRIYVRCSHTGNCCPIGLEMPHDPDYLRRDLINQQMMRFNAIRFIAGVPKRYQLDLADEIGLMVYDESYAAWLLGDSPKMKERYNESVFGMIRRDRNHPSVTADGKCRLADGKWQMADDKCRMADDRCEVSPGGCAGGESGEPTPEVSQGRIDGGRGDRLSSVPPTPIEGTDAADRPCQGACDRQGLPSGVKTPQKAPNEAKPESTQSSLPLNVKSSATEPAGPARSRSAAGGAVSHDAGNAAHRSPDC